MKRSQEIARLKVEGRRESDWMILTFDISRDSILIVPLIKEILTTMNDGETVERKVNTEGRRWHHH
jgi:hypothetical protein